MKSERRCCGRADEEGQVDEDEDGGGGGSASLFTAGPTDATLDAAREARIERTSGAPQHVRVGEPDRGETLARPGSGFFRPDSRPVVLHTEAGSLRVWPRWAAVDLTVTAASHVQVRLTGATRWFRAGMVHLERSTGVVGSRCLLRQEEHFHLHHLEVSFDLLGESQAAMGSLRRAIAKPGARGRVRQFQRVVSRIFDAEQSPDAGGQVTMRVREPCSVTARASTLVLGDGKKLNREVRFISELTTIDAAVLLARDFELAAAFISRLASGEGASAEELTSLFADAAGSVGDLDLIRGATDLRDPKTSVFRAHGREVVDNAVGVLIGTGNRLDRSVTVRRPAEALRRCPGLGEVNELAAQVRFVRWRRQLERREAMLAARERVGIRERFRLADRQKALDAREWRLDAGGRGLYAQERELVRREQKLNVREQELNERARALDARELRISSQERPPGEGRRGPEIRRGDRPKDAGDRDYGYDLGW
ncbi:hypothetical protein [Micromonospora sp. DT31]|uniref:hypothetical protein n=1 Tax=Micromonospora sp. DT31 TaxID=3393434 RepID=UPI003CFB2D5D